MGLSGISPAAQAVHADVAQLVEHHLAKVRVAGSSPVIRSQSGIHTIPLGVVGWPRGEAAACKAVYTGSNPVPTSGDWRRGSALPSHGRGHWFDPSIAHHISRTVRSGFLYFPSCCVMLRGYRLLELSRGLQTLELHQGSLRRVRPAYAFINPSAGGWEATPRFRQAGLAVCWVMNVTRSCAGVLAVQLGCMW